MLKPERRVRIKALDADTYNGIKVYPNMRKYTGWVVTVKEVNNFGHCLLWEVGYVWDESMFEEEMI